MVGLVAEHLQEARIKLGWKGSMPGRPVAKLTPGHTPEGQVILASRKQAEENSSLPTAASRRAWEMFKQTNPLYPKPNPVQQQRYQEEREDWEQREGATNHLCLSYFFR